MKTSPFLLVMSFIFLIWIVFQRMMIVVMLIGRVHPDRCSTIFMRDGNCKYMLPLRSGLSMEDHLFLTAIIYLDRMGI